MKTLGVLGKLLSNNFIRPKAVGNVIGWASLNESSILSTLSQIRIKILSPRQCSSHLPNIEGLYPKTLMCGVASKTNKKTIVVTSFINIINSIHNNLSMLFIEITIYKKRY